MWMKESKALTMSVFIFRGQIPWHFSLSEINITPAAPDLELILFPLWYWPIMNAHTKQQEDKVLCLKQILLAVKPPPPWCVPFGTKAYILYDYMYPQGILWLSLGCDYEPYINAFPLSYYVALVKGICFLIINWFYEVYITYHLYINYILL